MTSVLEPPPFADDASTLAALRAGDEAAFTALVERYHAAMVRLATAYVPSHSVAEEVAQEAWLGVLNGLGRFEGRSSLKTWIFRILTNIAKTRGVRESRSIAFSSVFDDPGDDEPSVDPDRFGAHRTVACGMLSIAATFPLDQVVNIVDACSFCMALPNILAIYLLMPELRRDLANYWQRVVLKGPAEIKNVA